MRRPGGADGGAACEASGLSLSSCRASVERTGSHQILQRRCQGCAGAESISEVRALDIQLPPSTRWSRRRQFHPPHPYHDSAAQDVRIVVESACLGESLLRLHQSEALRACVYVRQELSTCPPWDSHGSTASPCWPEPFERVRCSATVLLRFGFFLTHTLATPSDPCGEQPLTQ